MVKMYGIPNCDNIKKAVGWLQKNNVPFQFHDYKTEGIKAATLKEWCRQKGWETIFNKRSTTWKEISAASQLTLNGEADAIQLMQQHTSIIKRPVIEFKNEIIVGYNESTYIDKLLSK